MEIEILSLYTILSNKMFGNEKRIIV